MNHLESLRQLQSALQEHLDPALLQHCSIANCQNGILTLAVQSASWASRLRYSVPEILKALPQTTLPVPVKSVRVIVTPQQSERPETRLPVNRPSRETATLLGQFADSINDAELSACIRRLCRHSSVEK